MIQDRLTSCSLLLIDDEEANLDLLEGLLEADGYTRIERVSDARLALDAFAACEPDLILLDLHMPFLTGYELLAEIRSISPADDYLPVLVLTADVTSEARERALSHGARDFLTKPFDAVEVLLRVRNLLETRLLHRAQAFARRRAEEAERHARTLAEVSRLVGGSLDSETALTQVSYYLLPELAASADFLVMEGTGHRVVPAPTGSAGVVRREIELDPSTDPLASALDSQVPQRLELGGREALLVPLRTATRRHGALLVTPPIGRECFSRSEVDLFADIGGRAALALENARLFADAQMASRARERMLGVVAHDLRNPLAVIGMYSEMLLGLLPGEAEDPDDQYAAEALTSIYKSAHRMQEQIESLLDVSRLQEGTFVVRRFPCGMADFFVEAEMLLRPLAAARSIDLVFERGCDAGESVVMVDGARLQQVISNLVGNALKFTPEGGQVRVVWEVGERGLEVTVTDSGPGIPPDQLPHIFGAFWQAGKGDRRGLGLGLWIARAIVEGHGGRIWVDSAPGRGASFHFAIPTRVAGEDGLLPETDVGQLTHEAPQVVG